MELLCIATWSRSVCNYIFGKLIDLGTSVRTIYRTYDWKCCGSCGSVNCSTRMYKYKYKDKYRYRYQYTYRYR